MPFRILSIDGGGLRGIIPIQFLKEVRRRTGKPISESFDLIAGTSTGGILAAALNIPDPKQPRRPLYELEEIEDFYIRHGKEIFPVKKTFVGRKAAWVRKYFRPQFSAGGLDNTLSRYFGTRKFADLLHPVLITSYDAKHGEPLLFSSRFVNRGSDGFHRVRNIDVTQLCRATSAAPTYFPAYELNFANGAGANYSPVCIDGGIYINNPALAAVLEVLRNQGDSLYRAFTGLEDLYVLSLGTGTTLSSMTLRQGLRRGAFGWARPAPEMMMQANSQTVDYQLRQLLTGDQYLRMNISIEKHLSDMADATEFTRQRLIERINRDVINNRFWLDDLQAFIDRAGL